jgi:hypothetical protein
LYKKFIAGIKEPYSIVAGQDAVNEKKMRSERTKYLQGKFLIEAEI